MGRATSILEPSAAMTMVENPEATRPAEAPASGAVLMAAVAAVAAARTAADITNPQIAGFSRHSKIRKRREALCGLGT
jgi:hypothetical protein